MNDDRKEGSSAPSGEPEGNRDGEEHTAPPLPPFVDNSATNTAAIFARRWRPTAAVLDTSNQVFPPSLSGTGLPSRGSNKTVQYVDFGFAFAREFWVELVIPGYERFIGQPNRANAITASGHAWHVHEWIWHDQHPGDDTRNSIPYKTFQKTLIDQCPELAWNSRRC